jgi:hypothetical protein
MHQYESFESTPSSMMMIFRTNFILTVLSIKGQSSWKNLWTSNHTQIRFLYTKQVSLIVIQQSVYMYHMKDFFHLICAIQMSWDTKRCQYAFFKKKQLANCHLLIIIWEKWFPKIPYRENTLHIWKRFIETLRLREDPQGRLEMIYDQ